MDKPKGIHWYSRDKKWRISFSRNGTRYTEGMFDSLEEAIERLEKLKDDLPSKRCKDYIQNARVRNTKAFKKDKCERCNSTNKLILHHIVPINWGGEFTEDNCITLCKECHHLAHVVLGNKLTLKLRHDIMSKHIEEIKKLLAMAGVEPA